MPTFTWNDSYSVNIKILDEQHKKLFTLIDQLHNAMSTGKGKQMIGQVLDEMLDYTRTHFTTEEDLLKKHNYPDLLKQQKEHAAFVQKVSEMQQKFNNGSLTLSIEVSQFLKDWLSKHILGADKQYAQFLTEKGEH
ncbi:MAG: bacteriohemerythrin [Anaerolineae bacterium]|nr:bacteriohemerythrin [Anaerolineae bacterium]